MSCRIRWSGAEVAVTVADVDELQTLMSCRRCGGGCRSWCRADVAETVADVDELQNSMKCCRSRWDCCRRWWAAEFDLGQTRLSVVYVSKSSIYPHDAVNARSTQYWVKTWSTTHEGMRSTGRRGLQRHAYILYLTSLVTLADWPAEFIISQSQGDVTAVINIRITQSTKRQNTNVIACS